MIQPQAVIFDLDGTLIDSAPDIGAALNRFLARHGRPAVTGAQVRSMIGDGAGSLLRYAFAATGAPLEPGAEARLLPGFLDDYEGQPADPRTLYPGVPETLEALAGAGIALGLCTNKPERVTVSVLGQVGLAGRFKAVAGGDTLAFRKPDGRHLAWVAERLGAPPAASVMVGDNANDVDAARSAGMPVVAVSYGYPRMPVADLGADLVIDRFAELPGALARLSGGRRP